MSRDQFQEQVNELNNHLVRIGNGVRDFQETSATLNARMAAVEQMLVRNQNQDGLLAHGGPGLASRFHEAASGHSGFEHIQAWNQGSARIPMPGTAIKAHLTTDGKQGTTSDTSYPTRPEFGGAHANVFRPLRLLDVLPSRKVHSDAVEFVRLEHSGNAGYQGAEGATKPEVSLDGTPAKSHILTIAAWTSASRQVLTDNEQLGGLIDGVLRNLLMDHLEAALINGQGDTSNADEIAGLLANGLVATDLESVGLIDQTGEIVQRQRGMGYNPAAIVMNPIDWHLHVATQRAAADGQYLFGSPTTPAPASLWGLPVVLTPSLDVGCAMSLDTSRITLLDREEATVLVSNSHHDFFVRNLVAILAELRAGLEILDEGAVFIVPPSSE